MAVPERFAVPVRSRGDESAELFLLRLAPLPPALRASYVRPGQYVEVTAPGIARPAYLAIASAPGAEVLELLVRDRGGDFARALRTLGPGDTLDLSAAMGPGYPLAEADGRDLWLVGVGTGISALRPVALVVLGEPGQGARLHVLFGARIAEDFPFKAELAAWRAAGAEVILTVSRDGDNREWTGERGHVQDVLRRRRPDLGNAEVCMCGMAGMVEGVKAATAELGLPPGRLHTNY